MGQNSEEAAELVATIRGEHVVMKNWFMGSSNEAAALREKYGPYPGLWKEVLNWPGWKEARKAYLAFIQTGGSSNGDSNNNKHSNNDSATGQIDSNNSDRTSNENNNNNRKRRSRWGVAGDENDDKDRSNGDDRDSPTNKRRSRWGRDQPPSAPAPAPTPPAAPVIPKPLPALGLPGMPTNLAPDKQEEMRRCQDRLKEINHKLENLDEEASRVDALPRGHRDRSPSPPPGKKRCEPLFFFLIRT